MKQFKYLIALVAFMCLARVAFADSLCNHAMQYAPVSISTAATTKLVSGVANNRIVVCGYNMSVAGTTPTFQFEYGFGVSCGTGTATITGAYAPISGSMASFGGANQSIMAANTSADLCLVTTGTGVTFEGVLDYVVIP